MSSDKVEFIKAENDSALIDIENLASKIWREHYAEILTIGQIEYMLEHFQSLKSMKAQIQNDGYIYHIIKCDGVMCGYFAYCLKDSALFLSKVYIDKSFRGRGISRRVFSHLEDIAKASKMPKITLTVNKYNADSIAIYKKIGFTTYKEESVSIGHGYFMDDYFMEKIL